MADNITGKTGDTPAQTVTLASKDIGGVQHPKNILVDGLGNELNFSGPSIIGSNYQSVIGTSGLTAFAADGPQNYSMGPYGQMPITFLTSNGGLVKSPRIDLNIAPTTYSSSDNVPLIGTVPFRYDPRQSRPRPERSMSWAKTLSDAGASNNLQLISATPVTLGWIRLENKKTANIYLKVFDATATANVTMGTTVPILNLPIKANDIFSFAFEKLDTQLGCVIAFTAGSSATDNTSLVAGDFVAASIAWAA